LNARWPAERSTFAARPVLALSAVVAVVLVVFAHGYGYHRDELYFLAAGRHLSWSFADQGPVTPLIAHVMDALAPGSLTGLRLPSAVMAGGVVAVTGALAYELGADRREQAIAAGCMAAASVMLVVGHLLSTSTFDLLAWAVVTWLTARVIRTGRERLWLLVGVVTGLALLNKPLLIFGVTALAAGVLIAGRRDLLRSRWLWAAVVIAAALWSPWLIWQAAHGWPQLEVSSAIAAGGSASSQPRWAILPFQLLLVSPLLAPVWIAGLIGLLTAPRLRPFRAFGIAWIVLLVFFLVLGGKPYYLAGMFPVLLAAGIVVIGPWVARARRRRTRLLWGAIAISALVSAAIALPVLPADDAGVVVAVNPDVGETIGWPALTDTVARIYHRASGRPVIFTENYGEAGAIDRYGPARGLPAAYSGHNAFADWGPPPDRPSQVIVVGLPPARVEKHFRGCRVAARIENDAGIDNDEKGQPVVLCAGTRAPWSRIWSALRHLG
jgi:4-amino-4-deoxy-L-arabinose transferase-like glycosyltransferase